MTEQMNVPKLRFGGFSGGLLVTRLSEIINKLESGVSVNSEDVPPNSNQNGVLKTSAIYAGSFNPEQAKVITDSSELQRARLNPKKDSIIISRMNTPALVGESGYISKDYPNLFIPDRLWQATVSSQHCARWLSFLLTSPRTRFIISSKGTGTSNSMKNISKPSFLSIDAVTPTLPEQQKIASFLSKVDEKIGLLSEKKDKLTEYKRGVMQQLFNGKWQEQDGQLIFVPPTLRFKADDGSEFPDWEERTMASLFPQIRNGFVGTATPFYALKNDGIKYLQGKNIKKNQIDSSGLIYVNSAFHTKNTKSQLKEHDIVMVQSGHVGECARITKEFEGANCHALLVSTPNLEKVNSCFFVYYFYSQVGKKQIHKITTGNTIKHILGSDLKEIKVNSPSLSEQTKIANFLTAIDHKLELASTEIEKAKEWKKGLLQQMFV
ncbi:restriction endonuclease subunit S [Vibrio cyclitrophicus]|uniref:restriction endonuclease subunit S n=1 Tax=Vibrio cyclitrophicus TaxID=47951 RepID=UPI000CBA0140|nr:restriction endonuclease subunit S [Vibrio cyclitrophicus]PME40739.1 hypothetical protein BCV36_19675 [Vibrio cyclitrophicus]PME56805.1 hypothetical protein BCV37_22255 [Vibrio cyclitrophicus]